LRKLQSLDAISVLWVWRNEQHFQSHHIRQGHNKATHLELCRTPFWYWGDTRFYLNVSFKAITRFVFEET